MGYNNSYRIQFGTKLSTGTPYGANITYSNGEIRFLSTYYTDSDEKATFHRMDHYDDPVHATEYFSMKTTENVTANLNVSGTTTLNKSTSCIASLSTKHYQIIQHAYYHSMYQD